MSDFAFRKLVQKAPVDPIEYKETLVLSDYYSDLRFKFLEFKAIKQGLLNTNSGYGLVENQYFYNLGKKLGLNGLIEKLNNSISFIEVETMTYLALYVQVSSFCKECDFRKYYNGLFGNKPQLKINTIDDSLLLQLSGYERYLNKGNNNVK